MNEGGKYRKRVRMKLLLFIIIDFFSNRKSQFFPGTAPCPLSFLALTSALYLTDGVDTFNRFKSVFEDEKKYNVFEFNSKSTSLGNSIFFSLFFFHFFFFFIHLMAECWKVKEDFLFNFFTS